MRECRNVGICYPVIASKKCMLKHLELKVSVVIVCMFAELYWSWSSLDWHSWGCSLLCPELYPAGKEAGREQVMLDSHISSRTPCVDS